MKKWKEKASRYLAVLLTLLMMGEPGVAALAAAAPQLGERESKVVTSARLQKASESDADEEEDKQESDDLEDDSDWDEVDLTNDLDGVGKATDSDAEELDEEELATDSNAEEELLNPDEISLFSFMPVIDEVWGDVFLNDYPQEKLDAVPVDLILSRLQDEDGEAIEVPDEGKVVWMYYVDADGEKMEDEAHVVERDGTVDLSSMSRKRRLQVEFLMGTGNQLDTASIRYHVTVYLTNSKTDVINETLDLELFRETGDDTGKLYGLQYMEGKSCLSDDEIPVTRINCYAPGHQEGDIYNLKIGSSVKKDYADFVDVDVYQLDDFLTAYENHSELTGAINDQIMVGESGTYEGTFQQADSTGSSNVFCIVYTDVKTGVILNCRAYEFVVAGEEVPELSGQFFSYENGTMKAVTDEEEIYMNFSPLINGCSIKLNLEKDHIDKNLWNSTDIWDLDLKSGYPDDREYYFVLAQNDQIEKVVRGIYESLEDAVDAEDITSAALPADRATVPYGYKTKVNYNEEDELEFSFTVFFKDGSSTRQQAELFEAEEEEQEHVLKLDDKPIVNREDPYFKMTGAVGSSSALAVKNNRNYTMDTYYGYGYQTVFLQDKDADLTHLKPEFTCPESVTIHSGEKQESGVSEKDFSDGPVSYQAHIGDKKRNYQVTFVTRQDGPSLFVNGPEKREVFLTKYFDYHHDILIANAGDEPLTGLKVELADAQHVKLDDYWIVGGEGNDTLGAFTRTWVDSQYVSLSNLAKVRLLPDGEGELYGTLIITADGQETVEIELQGYASNPLITSDGLGDAVKYVPYSYMIATNNMYYEVQETYKIIDGTLPKGLELKASTGEIYGVPLESGIFPIKVEVTYQNNKFEPSRQNLKLVVKENTNTNVYNASDKGYEIEEHIGTETAAGNRDYLLTERGDQLYVSAGIMDEFVDLWLNGEKLVEGTDYTKVSGSTRMTIKSQTFQSKGQSGTNTIAAEFRTGSGEVKQLKRTSQNFRMEKNSFSGGASGGSSGDSSDDSGNRSNTADTTTASGDYNDASWTQDENGWRCKKADGTWLTNIWQQIPYQGTMNWYYFKDDGYLATGWFVDRGKTYYLNTGRDGVFGAMSTGWNYIDNVWYYFSEDEAADIGAMQQGGWAYLLYNGKSEWYYFDEQGKMMTGWVKIGDVWYYLYPVADGTRGRMLSGWNQIDGIWYYFYEQSDERYGMMAANTRIGDDRVGSDGSMVQ